jgi:hypothetical protein
MVFDAPYTGEARHLHYEATSYVDRAQYEADVDF